MDGIVHDHAVTSKVLLQCRLSTACCKLEHLLLLAVLGNNSDRHRIADKDAGPPVHQPGGQSIYLKAQVLICLMLEQLSQQ